MDWHIYIFIKTTKLQGKMRFGYIGKFYSPVQKASVAKHCPWGSEVVIPTASAIVFLKQAILLLDVFAQQWYRSLSAVIMLPNASIAPHMDPKEVPVFRAFASKAITLASMEDNFDSNVVYAEIGVSDLICWWLIFWHWFYIITS